MYCFYLDKELLPVTPSQLQLKISNKNKTMTLINDGEINLLKSAGLTEVSFDAELPYKEEPYAIYKNGFKTASYFLDKLEKLKTNLQPFQFIVTRSYQNTNLYDTNLKVTLEDYKIKEDYKEGSSVIVTISLKQYRDFSTKTLNITIKQNKTVATANSTRSESTSNTNTSSSNQNTTRTYTVVKGDSLWKIAKKFYGNGSKYTTIYNANKDKIKNPNLIYPNQVLVIP